MTDLVGVSRLPVDGLADPASGLSGPLQGASVTDVHRFEQAMQRGIDPTTSVGEAPGSRPPTEAAALSAPQRLGDAILGTLNRLSSLHQGARQQVGQVLSAPEAELSPRRLLEVQAALSDLSVTTQIAANVTTQLARVVDQTAKMQ